MLMTTIHQKMIKLCPEHMHRDWILICSTLLHMVNCHLQYPTWGWIARSESISDLCIPWSSGWPIWNSASTRKTLCALGVKLRSTSIALRALLVAAPAANRSGTLIPSTLYDAYVGVCNHNHLNWLRAIPLSHTAQKMCQRTVTMRKLAFYPVQEIQQQELALSFAIDRKK